MGRCAHGPGCRGPLRSRRLHRLPRFDTACAGRRCAHAGGVPAVGAGAGRGRAHGGGRRPLCSAFHGADGRPDRHAGEPHRGEHARRAARHRLVPSQRHHQGSVPESGLHARCLSGLPAAARLHEHEPRPPHRGASQPVPAPGAGRRRFRAEASRVLRRVSRGDGSGRRVLSADCRKRVRAPRSAARQDDPSRHTGRSRQDPSRCAAHGRGRERRHLRRRPDQGGARPVRQHPQRHAGRVPAEGRRSLRRLQRLALPLGDRAAHLRFCAYERCRQCAQQRQTAGEGQAHHRLIEHRRDAGDAGHAAPRRQRVAGRAPSRAQPPDGAGRPTFCRRSATNARPAGAFDDSSADSRPGLPLTH